MNLSSSFIFLSLAILYGVIGLPALLQPKKFRQSFIDFLEKSNNLQLLSLILLFMAFLLLGTEWKISFSSNGLIAILGWIILVKGIMNLWFPKLSEKLARPFLNKLGYMIFVGIICLILSGAFAYLAYLNN